MNFKDCGKIFHTGRILPHPHTRGGPRLEVAVAGGRGRGWPLTVKGISAISHIGRYVEVSLLKFRFHSKSM